LIDYNPERYYKKSIKFEGHALVFKEVLQKGSPMYFIEYTTAFLKDLKNRGEISDYLFNELRKVCDKVRYLSKNKLMLYIEEKFATKIDSYEKNLLVQSSHDLWANRIHSIWGCIFIVRKRSLIRRMNYNLAETQIVFL